MSLTIQDSIVRQLKVDGLPPEFVIPDSNVLTQKYYAVGTQNYICNGTAFTFQNSNAELWDKPEIQGIPLGRHFYLEQPDAWDGKIAFEFNGSRVVLKQIQSTNQLTLLLQKTSSSENKAEIELTAHVATTNAKDGVAPGTCQGTTKIQVPFTAEYWFFKEGAATKTKDPAVLGVETPTKSAEPSASASPTSKPQSNASGGSATLGIAVGLFILLLFSKM